MGFGKLWSKITNSSLWSEPLHVRVVFVSMLSQADANGFVESSQAGIARLANVTLDQARDAIRVLESPDPDSGDLERNPENEGRRIEKVSAGWHVINYVDYRDRRDTDKRREYQRDLMRKKRSTEKLLAKTANMLAPVSTPLAPVSICEHPLAQAEAEAEAEAESTSNVLVLSGDKEGVQGESAAGDSAKAPSPAKVRKDRGSLDELKAYAVELGLPESDGEHAFDHWTAGGWKRGSHSIKCWRAAMRTWKSRGYFPSQDPKKNSKVSIANLECSNKDSYHHYKITDKKPTQNGTATHQQSHNTSNTANGAHAHRYGIQG